MDGDRLCIMCANNRAYFLEVRSRLNALNGLHQCVVNYDANLRTRIARKEIFEFLRCILCGKYARVIIGHRILDYYIVCSIPICFYGQFSNIFIRKRVWRVAEMEPKDALSSVQVGQRNVDAFFESEIIRTSKCDRKKARATLVLSPHRASTANL